MTPVGDSNNESEESLRSREFNSETLIGKPVVQKSTIFTETGGIDVGSPNQEQSLSFALPACAFQALLASEYVASDPTGAEICALHAAAVNASVEEWMALTEELGLKKIICFVPTSSKCRSRRTTGWRLRFGRLLRWIKRCASFRALESQTQASRFLIC